MTKRRQTLMVTIIVAFAQTSCAVPASPDALRDVDWKTVAGRDLNCSDDLVSLPFPPMAYDINGDHVEDTFVAMKCVNGPAPQPHQIEVFNGATDPHNPTRIAVLIRRDEVSRPSDLMYLDDGCVYLSGNTVTIMGRTHAPGSDPSDEPATWDVRTLIWKNNTFKRITPGDGYPKRGPNRPGPPCREPAAATRSS